MPALLQAMLCTTQGRPLGRHQESPNRPPRAYPESQTLAYAAPRHRQAPASPKQLAERVVNRNVEGPRYHALQTRRFDSTERRVFLS